MLDFIANSGYPDCALSNPYKFGDWRDECMETTDLVEPLTFDCESNDGDVDILSWVNTISAEDDISTKIFKIEKVRSLSKNLSVLRRISNNSIASVDTSSTPEKQ